jgi:hypothetical protein
MMKLKKRSQLLISSLISLAFLFSCSPTDSSHLPSSSDLTTSSSTNISSSSSLVGTSSSNSSLTNTSSSSNSSSSNSFSVGTSSVSSSSSSSNSSSIGTSSSSTSSSSSIDGASPSSSSLSSIDDKEKIEEALKNVSFGLTPSSFYLDEVKASNLDPMGFNQEQYDIVMTLTPFANINHLRLTYYLSSKDGIVTSSSLTKEFTGFKTDNISLSDIFIVEGIGNNQEVDEGKKLTINVSLSSPIHYSLTIGVVSVGMTTSLSSITFTKDDYSLKKEVTLTIAHDESSFANETGSLSFIHQDQELISYSLTIKNVDKEESNTFITNEEITLDNFKSVLFSLSLAKAPKKETTINLVSSSSSLVVDKTSLIFTPSDYSIKQEVSLSANIVAPSLDTYSFTLSLLGESVESKIIHVTVKAISNNYEIIIPTNEGYITDPLPYYVAYYETDYKINSLFASINGSDYIDVSSLSNSSVSPSYCSLYLPAEQYGDKPSVSLRASFSTRSEKLSGEPTYSLEGCKIKASVGDYVEYYDPWPSVPKKLINISTIITVDKYLHFEREGEDFYLPLALKSPSRIRDNNGYSPIDLSKIFTVSGDRKRPLSLPLDRYYTKFNSSSDMTFSDSTDKNIEGYSFWRGALTKSVASFNEIFLENSFDIHIREVEPSLTNNDMYYARNDEVNYVGMCRFYSSTNIFSIFINSSPYMSRTENELRLTIIHEMGHLLGFPDSVYALDDSIYSYGNTRDEETYFTPSDLATFRSWNIGKKV